MQKCLHQWSRSIRTVSSRCTYTQANSTAIFRVCRQTRYEATPVYYRCMILHCSDCHEACGWFKGLPANVRQQVQEVWVTRCKWACRRDGRLNRTQVCLLPEYEKQKLGAIRLYLVTFDDLKFRHMSAPHKSIPGLFNFSDVVSPFRNLQNPTVASTGESSFLWLFAISPVAGTQCVTIND